MTLHQVSDTGVGHDMTDEEKSLALIAQMKLDDGVDKEMNSADDVGWEEVSRKSSKKSGSNSPKRSKKKRGKQKRSSVGPKS